MKRIFWMFRTDLTNLEYYHEFKDVLIFEKECHDFYLLMPLYYLKNNDFDEIVIWRMYPEPKEDIIFYVGEKKFIQRWVKDFNEVFNYERPDISFFRGGFIEYCDLTKKDPNFFGLKLYLGSSKRVVPQFGGIYDKILVEDEIDLRMFENTIPFYKTANENIFKPLENKQCTFNLCWIANFTQIKHKGQEYFIQKISESEYLQNKNIVHIGNKSEIGKEMCNKYNVRNITFLNYRNRSEINEILNLSKAGIVTSNLEDGCPRVLTEILMSGTPLIKRRQTRMLDFYKVESVIEFVDNYLEASVRYLDDNYIWLKSFSLESIQSFTIDKICQKNLYLWKGDDIHP